MMANLENETKNEYDFFEFGKQFDIACILSQIENTQENVDKVMYVAKNIRLGLSNDDNYHVDYYTGFPFDPEKQRITLDEAVDIAGNKLANSIVFRSGNFYVIDFKGCLEEFRAERLKSAKTSENAPLENMFKEPDHADCPFTKFQGHKPPQRVPYRFNID